MLVVRPTVRATKSAKPPRILVTIRAHARRPVGRPASNTLAAPETRRSAAGTRTTVTKVRRRREAMRLCDRMVPPSPGVPPSVPTLAAEEERDGPLARSRAQSMDSHHPGLRVGLGSHTQPRVHFFNGRPRCGPSVRTGWGTVPQLRDRRRRGGNRGSMPPR